MFYYEGKSLDEILAAQRQRIEQEWPENSQEQGYEHVAEYGNRRVSKM